MELLNPLMLWGGLAIAIPIMLHFWHQKKGKVLEWAATQWLTEKNLQQSRGIRLDNLLLLLLRCLLVLLLSLILSDPLLNLVGSSGRTEKIHLVQPDKFVINNFKFELEEAKRKGEKIFWINAEPSPVVNIEQLPPSTNFNALTLQACLNKLSGAIIKEQLEIYCLNSQALAQLSSIIVPAKFQLHAIVDSSKSFLKPYLSIGDRKLFVSSNNVLTSNAELEKEIRFEEKPVIIQPVNALILNKDKAEQSTISASLKALTEVYQLSINIDIQPSEGKKYDWVFSDKPLPKEKLTGSTLYIISNTSSIPLKQLNYQKNNVHIPHRLDPQSSVDVFNGELPEWLAETLVKFYGLNPDTSTLSQQQLNSLFSYTAEPRNQKDNTFSKILLLTFIVILGAERLIALRKNA